MFDTLHTRVRRRSLLAVGALAVTLTACGGGDDSTVATGPENGGGASAAATFNDADVTFIRDMTPHHNAALEMAKLATDRAENPKVKDLAARIEKAQAPEIELMSGLAKEWGVELEAPASGGAPGHSAGGAKALEPLKGAAFDKAFLEEMIPHHESALQMSQQELKAGKSEEAKKLAQAIVDGQTVEIAEMKALLATL